MSDGSRSSRAARAHPLTSGLSTAARDELTRWLRDAATWVGREVHGCDAVDVAVRVGGELVSASGEARVEVLRRTDLVQGATSGADGQGATGGAPHATTVPLLVRGTVPGSLTLLAETGQPAPRLSDGAVAAITGRVEQMLSSPVLVAQADANAQWLRRAREARAAGSRPPRR